MEQGFITHVSGKCISLQPVEARHPLKIQFGTSPTTAYTQVKDVPLTAATRQAKGEYANIEECLTPSIFENHVI
jgi:hypothetical protein